MPVHTSLSITSWPKAIVAACYMTNSLPTKALAIHLMDFAVEGTLICLTFASTSYGRLEGLWSSHEGSDALKRSI